MDGGDTGHSNPRVGPPSVSVSYGNPPQGQFAPPSGGTSISVTEDSNSDYHVPIAVATSLVLAASTASLLYQLHRTRGTPLARLLAFCIDWNVAVFVGVPWSSFLLFVFPFTYTELSVLLPYFFIACTLYPLVGFFEQRQFQQYEKRVRQQGRKRDTWRGGFSLLMEARTTR